MTVVIAASPTSCLEEQPTASDALERACVDALTAGRLMRLATADLGLGRGAASFLLHPFAPMAPIGLASTLPTFLTLSPAFRTLRAFKPTRYSEGANAVATVFRRTVLINTV